MTLDEEYQAYEAARPAAIERWRQLGPNFIPRPMLHPYGKSWDQPDAERILVDDDWALMSATDFNNLLEYSHSVPTGCYEGKMWKCQGDSGEWYLRWYGVSNDPARCKLFQRQILLA